MGRAFKACTQLLVLLLFAVPIFSEVHAAEVVERTNSTTVRVEGTAIFGPGNISPLYNYNRTLSFIDHSAFMLASQEFDGFTPSSHRVSATGGASTQTVWGFSEYASGQVSALSAGVVVSANAGTAPQIGVSAIALATCNVGLTFDELVNVRIAYLVGGEGSASIVIGGGIRTFHGGWGVLDYVVSGLTLQTSAGSGASVFVDGHEDTSLPSSDFDLTASWTTTMHWAIAPIGEEPVLPGNRPNIPITIKLTPRPNPSGGFDPIPVGTQDMITTSDEPTYVGIGTKSILDEFEGILGGTVFESIEVKSIENPFTSFLLHDLPIGSNPTVKFGNEVRMLVADEPIDFGAEGIGSFVIEGLDPAYASIAPDALVFGLGFAQTGLAHIEVVPINTYHAADFNLDGNVDAADYTVWRDGLGLAADALHTQGDANGDGAVDEVDYMYWKANFGFTTGTEAFIAGVPEPSTLALFAIGYVAFGYRRRR